MLKNPYNEIEICELFRKLLLLETDDDPSAPRPPAGLMLRPENLTLLSNKGLLNRIFRRWYQTVWGIDNWSRHFRGTTPRQELSMHYPELADGRLFMSVKTSPIKGGELEIKPLMFSVKPGSGGVFIDGLKQYFLNQGEVFAPQFDKEFNSFAEWLLQAEKLPAKPSVRQEPFSSLGKYWRCFWSQAGANLVFNLNLPLSKAALLALSAIIQDVLTQYFASQPKSADNFLSTDELIERIWQILRAQNSRLLPIKDITDEEQWKRRRGTADKDYVYSTEIFYRLSYIFDRYILFPIERYFGGAELVWIDHQNFIHDFAATVALLNGKLKPRKKKAKNPDPFEALADTVLNLNEMWFAPCSYFRLVGEVRKLIKA